MARSFSFSLTPSTVATTLCHVSLPVCAAILKNLLSWRMKKHTYILQSQKKFVILPTEETNMAEQAVGIQPHAKPKLLISAN